MNLHRPFFLVAIAAVSTIASAAEPRPNLKGVVSDETGKPVEGATVYIWTAAVETGFSTFCPSCYADCGKRAETNDKGEFEIRNLDPELKFELMVAKEGLPPTTKPGVDPLAGQPVTIRVPPLPPLPIDPNQTISGVVTDLEGTPVANAMVTPEMISWNAPPGESTGGGGAIDGLDKFAITDSKGRFTLAFSVRPVKQWQLRVDARGFAGAMFKYQTSETAQRGLRIGPGAIVKGRLTQGGKPVAQAEMTLAHAGNTGGFYLGRERIGTDADGQFLFSGVPVADFTDDPQARFVPKDSPLDGWWVAPVIESVMARGAAAPKLVHVTRHDQIIDLGDVELGPALHIRGRVIRDDGQPIARGSRMLIESSFGGVSSFQPIAADGSFAFEGLYSGDWTIHSSIRGYEISPSNPNALAGFDGLRGNLESNIDNLTIVVDSKTQRTFTGIGPPYEPFKSFDPAKLPGSKPAK